ncbi:GerAB/ArcD/ProY family transporter [Pseudalkalibacillus caeni]|uniref:GerAB/ArcD/ProY family transporter n=1 Tax=Exobacillus caeni TaxID=2574798 RepID=UPI001484DB08|nr:endospore germination permease [Pseudalkalibacillus caeni]
MNYNALHTKEVFFILVLSTGLFNHVTIIPMLLESAARDSWLSVIVSVIPYSIFLLIVYYIAHNTRQENISAWLKEKYGAFAAGIIIVPLLIILFIHAALTLIDTSIWAGIYYLPRIPNPIISAILVISCYWISTRKLKELAVMSTIVLPMVVLLGFFIMGVNTNQKELEYLFPVFLNGYTPFLKGIAYSLSGLTEIYVIILLQHCIKAKVKLKQIALLGVVLTVLILGPLTGAIMEFGPVEARNLSFPAYEEWKLLKIGEFISRMDFLAMFQWISGAFFRIGLFMYIINHFFKRGKSRFLLPVLYLVIYGLTFLQFNTYDLNKFLYVYFLPVSLITVLAVMILLFVLVLIKKKRSYDRLEKTQSKQTGVEGS